MLAGYIMYDALARLNRSPAQARGPATGASTGLLAPEAAAPCMQTSP